MEIVFQKSAANVAHPQYREFFRASKLLVRRCNGCGEVHFMPRFLCPVCWSEDLEWVESKGTGVISSLMAPNHTHTPVSTTCTPYIAAVVELDEGLCMEAHILNHDRMPIQVGARVSAIFEGREEVGFSPQFICVAHGQTVARQTLAPQE